MGKFFAKENMWDGYRVGSIPGYVNGSTAADGMYDLDIVFLLQKV